ncbi:MAG: hypothetical protein MJ090_04530 [Clostridia bacterium]|nr:hypothetical protein [Clostridia bacterium]
MREVLHKLYYLSGLIFCRICLCFWSLRDIFSKPETESVLFVAHPDDDTLFFHQFIKENKPYVCLMTTGYSFRRLPCFFKVMKQYGVRYRAYPLRSREERANLLEKQVKTVLNIKNFKIIATHNENGEYGHEEHIRVHNAVVNVAKGKNVKIYCPEKRENIENYPASESIIAEKEYIFKNLYTTEAWVLDEEDAGTPVWVKNEHLERIDF